jgi:hypothetical protein
MGWFATRREMKRTMAAFLAIAFVLLTCWAIMYYSLVFRWTWLQWPFFASLTVASQLVLVGSIVLGVLSWKNFGKGLAQFCECSMWFHGLIAHITHLGHIVVIDGALARNDFEPEIFPHDTASITSAASLSEVDIEKKGREFNYRLSVDLPSQAPKVYVVPSLGKNDPWARNAAANKSVFEDDDETERLGNVAH